MKGLFNLKKKFNRSRRIFFLLYFIFLIGLIIFIILAELGRWFYPFGAVIVIVGVAVLMISYRIRCKKMKQLQDYLNQQLEDEGFTYLAKGGSAYNLLLQSHYSTDKKAEIKDKITGQIKNIEFERVSLEFYHEFLDFSVHYDSVYANLYIFRNVCDKAEEKYFVSYDKDFIPEEEFQCVSNYKMKGYFKEEQDIAGLSIPYLSFFVSFIQGNVYFYSFNEKSYIDLLELESEEQFKDWIHEEVQKVCDCFESITEIMEYTKNNQL